MNVTTLVMNLEAFVSIIEVDSTAHADLDMRGMAKNVSTKMNVKIEKFVEGTAIVQIRLGPIGAFVMLAIIIVMVIASILTSVEMGI